MDEELKRIEFENNDLQIVINLLKEQEKLFIPTAEDAEVLLKDAKEDDRIYQLKNFTIENHEELLTQEEKSKYINCGLWQIPHGPDYFDTFTVYDIKNRSLILINSKIKKYKKKILKNQTFLIPQIELKPAAITEPQQEKKLSDRQQIRNYLKKENIKLSQVENITVFSNDLKKQLNLSSKQSSIRRFLQELKS